MGGACCSLRYAPVHISELGLDHSGVGIAKQLKRILETWAHLLNQPGGNVTVSEATGFCLNTSAGSSLFGLVFFFWCVCFATRYRALVWPKQSQESGLLKNNDRESRHSFWLGFTTLGADGAYVGETGISLDAWLAVETTLCGRVGFQDYLHLYDSVGRSVLQHRKPAKRDQPPQEDAGPRNGKQSESSSSSSSSATSSDSESSERNEGSGVARELSVAPPGLQAWLKLLRQQKRLFKLGAARRILNKQLEKYGFTRRSGIQAPGALKYIVYCSNYLRQSFRHFAASHSALSGRKQILFGCPPWFFEQLKEGPKYNNSFA